MAKTREPTLADLFIAMPYNKMWDDRAYTPPKLLQEIKNTQHHTRLAEKFVFDKEASLKVGTVLRDVPELLAEQIQFARAPFDKCWIEYDCESIFGLLNPGKTNPMDGYRDKRIGILVNHNRITVVSETADGLISLLPFIYHLNTEWTVSDQLRFCDAMQVSRLGIDHWLWGAVANKFQKEGKNEYLRVLRDTNMVEFLCPEVVGIKWSPDRMMDSCVGDFKNHVATLLLLNRPTLTVCTKVENTRGWIRSKPRPFMAYSAVHMALDPVPVIRKISEGSGESELRRRHRVRGHYCHNDAARKALLHHTCIHQWQPADDRWEAIKSEVGDDVEHWVCLSSCGGRRWWREQHERGNAGVGYVDHTKYTVEA